MTRSGRALVLPGAVAKGAYEAGVLSVLTERGVSFDHLVATSSGSLNAVVLAAGIRAGRTKEAVQELISSWIEHGGWRDVLHPNPLDWIAGRGLSDRGKLITLLRELVKPCRSEVRYPIGLCMVVAPLHGKVGNIGKTPATTFEAILHFTGEDFDTSAGLERIFEAAAAACAFPGLFAPVEIPDLGPCTDGGAVNNTPIGYALQAGDIDRIIVPVPFPAVLSPPAALHGIALLEHLYEALVHERMYRDLRDSALRNRKLEELDALLRCDGLTSQQTKTIKEILGWHPAQITEIRPPGMLEGTLFSGFLSRNLRAKYVEEGRSAAEKTLQSL